MIILIICGVWSQPSSTEFIPLSHPLGLLARMFLECFEFIAREDALVSHMATMMKLLLFQLNVPDLISFISFAKVKLQARVTKDIILEMPVEGRMGSPSKVGCGGGQQKDIVRVNICIRETGYYYSIHLFQPFQFSDIELDCSNAESFSTPLNGLTAKWVPNLIGQNSFQHQDDFFQWSRFG